MWPQKQSQSIKIPKFPTEMLFRIFAVQLFRTSSPEYLSPDVVARDVVARGVNCQVVKPCMPNC